MTTHTNIKTDAGFTLIELLVVVAVLAIISAVAIPALNSWIPNYQVKGAARELFTDFQFARSQALKRNTNVVISFTTVTFPATGGGYTIFVDDGAGANAGNLTLDGDEEILLEKEMPELCSLTTVSFQVGTTADGTVTGYGARGVPLRDPVDKHVMLIGNATIRNSKSKYYRIALATSGYPKIEKSNDGSTWE